MMEPLIIRPRPTKKTQTPKPIVRKEVTNGRVKCQYEDGTVKKIDTYGLVNITLMDHIYVRIVGKNKVIITVDPQVHCEISEINDIENHSYGREFKIR